MLTINDVTRLYLGIQGENEAQTITIDVAPWLVAHPGGSVTIWHKRNGDEIPYPVPGVFDRDKETISWTPNSTDTYVQGEGKAEIRLYENGIIKKSREIITGVSPAVTGGGEPLGSGWQEYIDAVERAAEVAILKNGQIKFSINEDGHLIFSFTDQIPVAEEEDEENE